MQLLPSIHLPDYFLTLLKVNMQGFAGGVMEIKNFIYSNKSLNAVFNHSFEDIDPKCRPELIIKSLGWQGIRGRLINVYLNFLEVGHYQRIPTKDYAKEFDRIFYQLEDYSVEGYSRVYLLLFYVKAVELLYGKKKALWDFIQSEECLDLLNVSKSRVVEVDWILVFLFLHSQFFDHLELLQLLKNSNPYFEIYGRMKVDERKSFLSSSLAYSYSIKDDLFINNTVGL